MRKRLEIPPFSVDVVNPTVEELVKKRKKGSTEGSTKGSTKGSIKESKRFVKLSQVVSPDTYIPVGKYKGVRIKANLPDKLYKKLLDSCQESGISMSEFIRVAIWQALK